MTYAEKIVKDAEKQLEEAKRKAKRMGLIWEKLEAAGLTGKEDLQLIYHELFHRYGTGEG